MHWSVGAICFNFLSESDWKEENVGPSQLGSRTGQQVLGISNAEKAVLLYIVLKSESKE